MIELQIKCMRNILFILIGCMGISLLAQDQLRIEYELVEPEENYRDESLPAGIEIFIPKRYYELIVNQEESIWKSIEKINNEQIDIDKGEIVGSVSFLPEGDLYKNTHSKIYIKEEESFSKKYLVKDDLIERDWKISREAKEVLGIQVQKATHSDEENGIELIAWYAPKLNFKNGPNAYWGLPGLILELRVSYYDDENESHMDYTAINIAPLKSNKKIAPPTKGKVVTQNELNQISEENFERMKKMHAESVDKE